MSEETTKSTDLATGGTKGGGNDTGAGEASLFDALDNIMDIANRASSQGSGNGNGSGSGNGTAARVNGASPGNGRAPAGEVALRDEEIEQSLSEALDEIMKGGIAKEASGQATKPTTPKARDPQPAASAAAVPAAKPASTGAAASKPASAPAATARPASAPATTARPGAAKAGNFTENLLYQMLADLKSDIDALRHESEKTRARAFELAPLPDEASAGEKQMYGLLAELKADIDALKHETGAVGLNAIGARRHDHEAELYAMLSSLRSDITTLKVESEAFMHHGGVGIAAAHGGGSSTMRPVLVGAVTALAILAAAAGGFFYANMQRDAAAPAAVASAPAPAPAAEAQAPATTPAEPAKTETAATEPAKAAASDGEVKTRVVATTPVDGGKTMSADEENGMLTRAEKLLDQGDIVAARMILDYAVSQGSANAAFRLAQTYDPQYLATANLAIEAQADVTQALTLYYFAARSGHQEAADRLAVLKRETGGN